MYYAVASRRNRIAGLSAGASWDPGSMIMGVIGSLYNKLFSCTNPDWVGLNFDPDDRKPRRIYGMNAQDTANEINSKFIDPIAAAYGITHDESWTHVWNPIFQKFPSTWGIDLNSWAQISADFINWLASQGKSTDPRPYFAAHDTFGVEMEATCGGGRTKKKSLQPFSAVAEQLYNKISGMLPAQGTDGGSSQASVFSQIKPAYLFLGAMGVVLLLAASSRKRQTQPQLIYM